MMGHAISEKKSGNLAKSGQGKHGKFRKFYYPKSFGHSVLVFHGCFLVNWLLVKQKNVMFLDLFLQRNIK